MASRANKNLRGGVEAKALLEWIKKPRNIWLYAFCAERGYTRLSGNNLKNRSKEFEKAWEIAKCLAVHKVLGGAMFRELDPWIAKWYLSTNHPKDFPKEHDTTQRGGDVCGLMDKIVEKYACDEKKKEQFIK